MSSLFELALLSFDHRHGQRGAYDQLYKASGILWPDRGGRMVQLAGARTKPGWALDAGCGDAKNAVFLAKLGWTVDGFDVSSVALAAARRRIEKEPTPLAICLVEDRAEKIALPAERYDLIISYGLYHCLDDHQLVLTHKSLVRALNPGGMFAFAAFNDQLPVPLNHKTPSLFMRPRDHVVNLLADFKIEALEFGEIEEDHLPLVAIHRHALTWGLFRKPL